MSSKRSGEGKLLCPLNTPERNLAAALFGEERTHRATGDDIQARWHI